MRLSSKIPFFLVNPAAGNGSTGSTWPGIAAYLKEKIGDFETHLTSRPLEARRHAAMAVERGVRKLICVGGDGTLNEVINGVMDFTQGLAGEIKLGFFPNGTGCDLAKTLAVPRDVKEAVRVISEGETIAMDIGRISHADHDGKGSVRYFHNIASLGLGGEVVRRVNRTSKRFGPFLSFIWATLITIFTYERKRCILSVDGAAPRESVIWHIAVANGQFQGGGMWVAPDAGVEDGIFDITVVGDMTLSQVLINLHNLYNGRIKGVRNVECLRGKTVEVSSREKVFLDVDGEEPGTLPVRMELIPGAIKMMVDKGKRPGTIRSGCNVRH